MIIDVHCHYTFTDLAAAPEGRFSFEPARDAPYRDACISPRMRRSVLLHVLRNKLGVARDEDWDAGLARAHRTHLLETRLVERCVLLAFDRYHRSDGSVPDLPTWPGQRGSDTYTSNACVRRACRAHPERWLFGASIHPYRVDAEAAAEEVFASGACLVKWLPLHQNIDLDDARTQRFMACCARLGLPLLIHYGPEFTLATNHWEQVSVTPLLETLTALRRVGDAPTVIVAHAATGSIAAPRRDVHLLLAAMRGPLRDAPLYADISALTTIGKAPWAAWLGEQQDLHPRMLFGSDYPIPVSVGPFVRRLGRAVDEVRRLEAWPDRAVAIARGLGFGETVFQRAADLLPNVGYFAAAATPAGEVAR